MTQNDSLPASEGRSTNWTTIQPNRNWLRLNVGEVLRYRDLIYLFVRRDFVSKYKQTILGPLWFIIQPLMTTVVFGFVFGTVAGISTEGAPGQLFYLSGLLIWQYFAGIAQATGNTFTVNAPMFTKVYFPRIVVPISVAFSGLITLTIQTTMFFILFVYYKYFTEAGDTFHLTNAMLAMPFLILQTGMFALGVGLTLSALTAKYRDFLQLQSYLIQLWLYATTVIYPLSVLIEKVPAQYHWLINLNPMIAVVENYRMALLGAGNVSMEQTITSACVSFVVFLIGALLFNRTDRTFADTV